MSYFHEMFSALSIIDILIVIVLIGCCMFTLLALIGASLNRCTHDHIVPHINEDGRVTTIHQCVRCGQKMDLRYEKTEEIPTVTIEEKEGYSINGSVRS